MDSLEALKIIIEVRKIDWHYNYSDDYSVWKAGEQSMSALKSFFDSREWTEDDILTLEQESINVLNLRTYPNEEDRQKSIDLWQKRLNDLFNKRKSNNED